MTFLVKKLKRLAIALCLFSAHALLLPKDDPCFAKCSASRMMLPEDQRITLALQQAILGMRMRSTPLIARSKGKHPQVVMLRA